MQEVPPPGERQLSVLLVEDELAHAEIARRNLSRSPVPHKLFHVHDGRTAIDYLHRRNGFEHLVAFQLPDVILLDLNMPNGNGLDVLREIQNRQEFRKICSIVLTTSDATIDKEAAVQFGAAGYLLKPINAICFAEMLENFSRNA